jgi:hypothetical protein
MMIYRIVQEAGGAFGESDITGLRYRIRTEGFSPSHRRHNMFRTIVTMPRLVAAAKAAPCRPKSGMKMAKPRNLSAMFAATIHG